jgi:hypothetical protein
MGKMRHLVHENKAIVSVTLMALSLVVMILAFYALPDDKGNEGSGPMSPLLGWNYIVIGLAGVVLILSGYFIYRYVTDKARFEELMNSNSQAIFKRNQIEIERLALRLTSKEEKRVLDAMKKYKIR